MKSPLLCLPFAALLSWIPLAASVNAASADQPNLLIIQTDEHNFRTLGCYRDTLPKEQALIWGDDAVVETPAIDSIAKRGAICTSFYATSPVCTPSRAAFFSGRYPQNTGSPQNDRPLNSNIVTFAEVLRRDGYTTGYAGKWHLDGPGKPQWAPERKFGFDDNRFMFNRGHWKKFELTPDGPRVGASNAKGQPTYNLSGADKKTFSTDWLSDRAVDFIRKNASETFCFHLSLPDPHGPNTVRAPYDEMYAQQTIRAPMTFAMARDNPGWVGNGKNKNGVLKFSSENMARYFGMVRCIDDNVAKILATLDELKLTDKTVIVFTSDHGDLCYEHGRLNKGNPYEGSAKIPMLIAAPGKISPGTQVNEALGTVDFAPTILTLMGKTAGSEMQGRNASALLTSASGKVTAWNDVTFIRAAQMKAGWIAAVSDRYKLILSLNEKPWLVDLQNDPDELANSIDTPANKNAMIKLATALQQYGRAYNEPQLNAGPLAEQLQQILASEPKQ